MGKVLWILASGGLLATIFQQNLIIFTSLMLPNHVKLGDYVSLAATPTEFIPPLPMLDLSLNGRFSQEELDKYIHIAKELRQPVIIRNIVTPEELAAITDDFMLVSCNNTGGKYIDNNLLESNRNIKLKDALNIGDRGGLFQALDCCNMDMPRAVHMPTNPEYWEKDNATALVVARLFHTKMHSHPDITVHFALRNNKRWTILHPDAVSKVNPKFGRTVPMGTNLFINETLGLKRWEFDTHQGDVLIIPPWGFHGIEYYNDTTTVSWLASIYNHDVVWDQPVMSIPYFAHILRSNWRVAVAAIVKSVSEPSLIPDRVAAAIKYEVYSKH